MWGAGAATPPLLSLHPSLLCSASGAFCSHITASTAALCWVQWWVTTLSQGWVLPFPHRRRWSNMDPCLTGLCCNLSCSQSNTSSGSTHKQPQGSEWGWQRESCQYALFSSKEMLYSIRSWIPPRQLMPHLENSQKPGELLRTRFKGRSGKLYSSGEILKSQDKISHR